MAEVRHKCSYCEHVMGERFMYYDETEKFWTCKSMTACVHRMEIALKYSRPPLGYVFAKDKDKKNYEDNTTYTNRGA